MTSPLRRAGRIALPDGRLVLWSVAEGRRGRRWRASTRSGTALVDDLLLETDGGGRFARLEYTTAAGQLTLHPEPDFSAAHGNLVGPDGVRHLALGWSSAHGVEIPSSPIADAALLAGIAQGGGRDLTVASIGADLRPVVRTIRIDPAGGGRWRVGDRVAAVDANGLPTTGGADDEDWPLEDPTVRPA